MVGRMHGMHARPGQLLRHRVWRARTNTAQHGHTGQLRRSLSSLSSPLSICLSLYLSLCLLYSLSVSLHAHKASSHIPLFPLFLSNCCGLKRGWREGNEIERKRQKESGSYHRPSVARTNCTGWPPWISPNPFGECSCKHPALPPMLIT